MNSDMLIGRRTFLSIVPAAVGLASTGSRAMGHGGDEPAGAEALDEAVRRLIRDAGGDVAVAYHDLATGEELLVQADATFHAASTMKVPVLMELYRQVEEKTLSLDDRIAVKTEFTSIVNGTPFTLKVEDDSETTLYRRLGERMTVRELARLMITESSNVATNLLVDRVTAARTSELMVRLGAKDIHVLRGVEDGKAYARDEQHDHGARAHGDPHATGGAGRRLAKMPPRR